MNCKETRKTNRKRRSDRRHVIYMLTCEDTGKTYVGITVARGSKYLESARYRWVQHCYKALNHGLGWPLHEAIRKFDSWSYEVLEVVRGKVDAHAREREIIREVGPELNRQ